MPDSATAIRISEAILAAKYGDKPTRALRPFQATLADGLWTVERRCKTWCVGWNPTVKLRQQNGEIVSVDGRYLK